MTTPSPIAAWLANAAAALQNDSALVDATNADSAATASSIAIGFLAQAAAIGAPLLAGALSAEIPGSTPAAIAEGQLLGKLVGNALTNLSTSLAAEHANALAPLTPDQQALATQALQTGATLLAAQLPPPKA